jgi:hypothetical protein
MFEAAILPVSALTHFADAPPGGVVGCFNAGHVGVWARKLPRA